MLTYSLNLSRAMKIFVPFGPTGKRSRSALPNVEHLLIKVSSDSVQMRKPFMKTIMILQAATQMSEPAMDQRLALLLGVRGAVGRFAQTVVALEYKRDYDSASMKVVRLSVKMIAKIQAHSHKVGLATRTFAKPGQISQFQIRATLNVSHPVKLFTIVLASQIALLPRH